MGNLVAFDSANNVLEYTPNGTSTSWTSWPIIPRIQESVVVPSETAGNDGLLAVYGAGHTTAQYSLLRAQWWGDAIGYLPFNPADANATTTGETPLAVASNPSGDSVFLLTQDKATSAIRSHYWSSSTDSVPDSNSIASGTFTYATGLPAPKLVSFSSDHYLAVAMHDPGNGLDTRILRFNVTAGGNPINTQWPVAETGFASDIAIVSRGGTFGNGGTATALALDCGGSGLRSVLYTLTTTVLGNTSNTLTAGSTWSNSTCSRVWAVKDTSSGYPGSGNYHVFAVINQSLVHYTSSSAPTGVGGWTQYVVTTGITDDDQIQVSGSVRGSPVVVVNTTAYTFDIGQPSTNPSAWTSTPLLDPSWFTASPVGAWQVTAADNGSRWGVYGNNLFTSSSTTYRRDTWMFMVPSNTVDQNCNGNP